MRLEKQIALVNGAASGIGECSALALAREGCTVVLTDIQEEPLRKVTESLNSAGFKAVAHKMDVTKADEIDAVVSRVIKQFGRIDILLQCSGIYPYSPFLEMPEEQFDATIRVNLKGTFLCCQRVAREMVKNNYGRIICLASAAGQRGGTTGRAHYGASKGGVIAMCKTIAHELGSFGITVNTIAPGLILTNMSRERIEQTDKDKLLAPLVIKRVGGAADIVGAVTFLASSEASYITGATIDINGGSLMR
jgi:2-hydroxycyclohexanecarboxyl-CoA dehydrogenase